MLDPPCSFNCSNSWESPAWTALTLILNCVNSTLWSPVKSILNWLSSNEWFNISIEEHLSLLVSKESSVFLLGPVSEFVNSESVGVVVLWVFFHDFCEVFLEDITSEWEFLFSSVWFSPFGNVLDVFHIFSSKSLWLEEWDVLWALVECEECRACNDSDYGECGGVSFSHLFI